MNVSQAIATINLYVYSDAGVTREMAGDAVDVLMLAVESLNAERNELRAERDALAAELATVRAQLEPVEPMLYRSAPPRRHEWDEQ